MDSKRVVAENALAIVVRDEYPVTPLHTLVIPKRHTDTYFNLFSSERRAIEQLVDSQRMDISAKDQAVGGFNIGINAGEVAGQTLMHCTCISFHGEAVTSPILEAESVILFLAGAILNTGYTRGRQ